MPAEGGYSEQESKSVKVQEVTLNALQTQLACLFANKTGKANRQPSAIVHCFLN
jgi:hypothetical protein